MEGTLKELFGYNQFKVIGQSRKALVTGSEDWMAQSKYFSLHVDSKEGSDKTGYLLNLKLFQEKSLLLETDAKLSKASPLVIKGPQVGGGQAGLGEGRLGADGRERRTDDAVAVAVLLAGLAGLVGEGLASVSVIGEGAGSGRQT